jgi:UDP-glucose 4-epimerase
MAVIIITGVAGFVGSNLANALLQSNHSVIGFDNFSYGTKANIEPLLGQKKFSFIDTDITHEQSLKNVRGDVIVHLASQKIPRYSSALRTLDENSLMLKNVLEHCNANKGTKLVFASTSDVYGKNPMIPYAETSDLLLGATTVKRWAYALSKIYSEQLIIAHQNEFDLPYTIMRFFGSYGPNQNTTWWGGPQAVFIQNILEGKTLEIHGDGLQTRTFTYIDDTVQGIVKCIFEKNAHNEIFNIASEPTEEITIKELAVLIWQLMKGNSDADLKLIPYQTFGNYEDVRRRVPNIDKIKSMLQFNPQHQLKDGLLKTIDWQTKLFKARK